MAFYCVDNLELVTAVSIAVENALRTLSGWIDKEKPDPEMIKGYFKFDCKNVKRYSKMLTVNSSS